MQMKISRWLKGMVILLGIMGIVYFGGRTWYAVYAAQAEITDYLENTLIFTWYTAILCYCVLLQFWNVCTQIGNDNSFSPENARSFHLMALYGLASGIGFCLRILWITFLGKLHLFPLLILCGLILLSLVFVILCESLSRLIQNAYEIKRENELTI